MIWALVPALWVTLVAGVYLALSRDLLRSVIGLALLGSGVNLLLLAAGRLESDRPPVVEAGQVALSGAANPVPQALVLTAVVIGFALACFALTLVMRIALRAGVEDAHGLRLTEPPPRDPIKPPLDEQSDEASR